MKKFLLLAGISVLALNSCKDEDIQYWELDQMNGTWKYDKMQLQPRIKVNGVIVDGPVQNTTFTGCDAENSMVFQKDAKKVTTTTYQDIGNGACGVVGTEEQDFQYDSSARTLTFITPGVDPDVYQVEILTKDVLQLMKATDYNNDNIEDVVRLTLKR